MPKLKSHKGLLKRIKVTGQGKVKFKSARSGHLRSHKSGAQIRATREKQVAKAGDLPRLEKMLHRHLKPAGYDAHADKVAKKEQAAKAAAAEATA